MSSTFYDRLTRLSRARHYDAFEELDWPESLPEDRIWMSPELLSIAGTELEHTLTEGQVVALSKHESLLFYSLSMFGERDLVQVVLTHIHCPGYSDESEYFHHFIEEENKHMWFFSQLCLRYGGKVYPNKAIKFTATPEEDIRSFVAFAKIMIFEEIGDYYNIRLSDDARLPSFIRRVNELHHRDESRHLAMGRRLLGARFEQLRQRYDAGRLAAVERYLKDYAESSLELFYSPAVYRDAGLADPYGVRRALCEAPSRRRFHDAVLERTLKFFASEGIFQMEDIHHGTGEHA